MPNDSERMDALIAAESSQYNSDYWYERWRDEQPPYVGFDDWIEATLIRQEEEYGE